MRKDVGLICSKCGCKTLFPVYFFNKETGRQEISHLECEQCWNKEIVDGDFTIHDFNILVSMQETKKDKTKRKEKVKHEGYNIINNIYRR